MLKEIFTSLLILFSTSSNSLVNANSNSFNNFLVSQKSEYNNISYDDHVNSQNYYTSVSITSISINENVVNMTINYKSYLGLPVGFFIQRSINDSDYINIYSEATTVYEDVIDKSLLKSGYVINYRIYYGDNTSSFSYSSVASVTYSSTASSTVLFNSINTAIQNENYNRYFKATFSIYGSDSFYKAKLFINDVNATSFESFDYIELSNTDSYLYLNTTYYYTTSDILDGLNLSYSVDTSKFKNGSNTYQFKFYDSSDNEIGSSDIGNFTADIYGFSFNTPTFTNGSNQITVNSFIVKGNSSTTSYYVKYYLDGSLKDSVSFNFDSIGSAYTLSSYTFSSLSDNTSYVIKIEFYNGTTFLNSYSSTQKTIDSSYAFWSFDGSSISESYFTITNSCIIYLGGIVRTTFTPLYCQMFVDGVGSSIVENPLKSDTMTVNNINYTYYGKSYQLNINSQSLSAGTSYSVIIKYYSDSNGSNTVFTSDTMTLKTLSNVSPGYSDFEFNTKFNYKESIIYLNEFELYSSVDSLKVEYYLNDDLYSSKNLTGVSGSYNFNDKSYNYKFSGTSQTFENISAGISYNIYCKFYNGDSLLGITSKFSVVVKVPNNFVFNNLSLSNPTYSTVQLNFSFYTSLDYVNLYFYVNDDLYITKSYNTTNVTMSSNPISSYLVINNLDSNTSYIFKVIVYDSDHNEVFTDSMNGKTLVIPSDSSIVDLTGLLYDILAMPFAFLSQAFNLTLFGGTAYAINFGDIIMFVIGVMILITVIKLVLSLMGK